MTRYEEVEMQSLAAARAGDTQTRLMLDDETVGAYADIFRDGKTLPAVVLFDDGEMLWIGDGFHRVEAAMEAGMERISAEIREGGKLDALRFALGANANHGLRRNAKDIENAILMAWDEREDLGLGEKPSARSIAELVRVSPTTVLKYLGDVWEDGKRTGADGKEYPAKAKRTPNIERRTSNVEEDDSETGEQVAHGFTWNKHGVCLDPHGVVIPFEAHGVKRAEGRCDLAQTPAGSWVYGYDLNVPGSSVGCGGQSCGASLDGKKYDTAEKALDAFLDDAHAFFQPKDQKATAFIMSMEIAEEYGFLVLRPRDGVKPKPPTKEKKVTIYHVMAKVDCRLAIAADSEEAAKALIEADGFRLLLEYGHIDKPEVWDWEKKKGLASDKEVMDLRGREVV